MQAAKLMMARGDPMDGMERFIGDGNISRFVDMLRAESDPVRQDMLRRLLIEEENRFGTAVERLTMAERYLRDGETHISRLARSVHEAKNNGHDYSRAQRTLELSLAIQELFQEFRSTLHNGVEKQRP